jgi:hypothetical protein
MIGMRPFTQSLMPCEDIESFRLLGYCPDQFIQDGKTFSPLALYTFASVFELLFGISLLYKTRNIYIEECIPLGLQY